MRARTILMILFAILVAGFAALNWSELARTTTLNFGVSQAQGPLGLIMLGLLLIAAVLFLAYAIAIQTGALMQARDHGKEMKAQRELAQNAEASRFTELRALIDKIETDSQTRQADLRTWFEQRIASLQQDVNSKVENSGNTLAAYMGELEDRIQRHLGSETPVKPMASGGSGLPSASVPAQAAAPEPAPELAIPPSPPAGASASITNFARRLFTGDNP